MKPMYPTTLTREDYLEFVAAWKENYKALAQFQRVNRIANRTVRSCTARGLSFSHVAFPDEKVEAQVHANCLELRERLASAGLPGSFPALRSKEKRPAWESTEVATQHSPVDMLLRWLLCVRKMMKQQAQKAYLERKAYIEAQQQPDHVKASAAA